MPMGRDFPSCTCRVFVVIFGAPVQMYRGTIGRNGLLLGRDGEGSVANHGGDLVVGDRNVDVETVA